MKVLNPVKVIRDIQKKKVRSSEAREIFKERLNQIFLPSNRQERGYLINKLKEKGVTAVLLKNLAESAARDTSLFRKRELRIMKGYEAVMLADVEEKSIFSNVVIVLRSLCAEDIAHDILCEDVIVIVVDDFLLHP